MSALDLYSEPFAKTGNIAAEGFRKLLGRPALGILQTVIREAIQNSLDAAKNGKGPEVLLRTRILGAEETEVLRNRVFAERPYGELHADLSASLDDGPIRVFEIADFHTTGLGGPTRADAPSDGKEDLDFVNFMRNVGAARDTHHGGGTYGYGKTALYALSACSTVVIDTQTRFRGQAERRVMGCRIGEAYDAGTGLARRRYTGRHWWGHDDGEGGVDPLDGADAAVLAAEIGLPDRSTEREGTTIMILAPVFDEDVDLRNDLIEAILWNFWPRMCRSTAQERHLTVRLEIDGEVVPVPDPEDFPPLDLFARALEGARVGDDVIPISSQRPAKHLGNLAIRRGLRADRHVAALRDGSLIPRQAAHIALMRPVELVVKYLTGEPFPDARFEWAGVFICSAEEEVEQAFADSEPPAHDDWEPANLPSGYPKRYVNIALTRLSEQARTYANPLTRAGQEVERGPSLASTATLMGKLLDKASATGPGRRQGQSRQPKRKRKSISAARFIRLEMDAGVRTAVFEADLVNDESDPGLKVVAEPYIVIDGGSASAADVPVGFSGQATQVALGAAQADGNVLTVGMHGGTVVCHVPVPDGVAVGVRFQLEDGGAA
ncbi:MAG: hypothetical protein KDK11_00145 [Maritimibacter sp.]|nr:hypothetical protein [Maritimibacter sp.]